MVYIAQKLRRRVATRAEERCEYCGLSQLRQEARFHVDHVISSAEGGRTTFENLALACVSCSLRKGARILGMDPLTNATFPLYNPRDQDWRSHFRCDGVRITGISAVGRATVESLKLNRPVMLAIREEEVTAGRYPAPWQVP